jgi:hypothetical protein
VPEDENNNDETTEEGSTQQRDHSIRDAQDQTPLTQIPSVQVQKFPGICNLEGLERNYYTDVKWFKAVILLAIFLGDIFDRLYSEQRCSKGRRSKHYIWSIVLDYIDSGIYFGILHACMVQL